MLRSNFTVRKFQRDLVCWFLSCLIIWKHYFQTIFLRYNLHLHDDSILLSFVHVSDFLGTIWSYTPPCTLKYLHFINAYGFCGHSIYFSCCFRLLNGIGYTIYLLSYFLQHVSSHILITSRKAFNTLDSLKILHVSEILSAIQEDLSDIFTCHMIKYPKYYLELIFSIG